MMLSIILICSEREAENRTTADYLKRELPSMTDQAELLVYGHSAQQEAWLDELAQAADVRYMQIGERTDVQLYADAMDRLKGELATALYGGDTYSDGAFTRIMAEAAKREKKQVFMPYKQLPELEFAAFASAEVLDVVSVMDVYRTFTHYPFYFAGTFVRTKALQAGEWHLEYGIEAEREFFLTLLARVREVVYLSDVIYQGSRAQEGDPVFYKEIYNPDWYFKSLREFWQPYLGHWSEQKGGIPRFIQYHFMFSIGCRVNSNKDNQNKHVIPSGQERDFLCLMGELFQYIDDEVLFDYLRIPECKQLDSMLWVYGILKYGDNFSMEKRYLVGKAHYGHGDVMFGRIENLKANILFMNEHDNVLHIDGTIHPILYAMSEEVYIRYHGKKYALNYNERYALTKVFGVSVYKRHSFSVDLPLEGVSSAALNCEAVIDGEVIEIVFSYESHFSRMSGTFLASYWCFGPDKKYMMVKRENGMYFHTATKKEQRRQERRLQWEMLKSLDLRAWVFIGVRNAYFLAKPFMKRKPVWMYLDKIYKGGDSSEYLYRYASARGKQIKHYYLIDKHAADYKRMRKDGYHPLVRGSIKHRLVFLLADMMVISNSTVFAFNNFGMINSSYVRDLVDFHVCCVQHGMSVQKIAVAQNRLRDNTRLYFCASQYEIENLSRPIYDYVGYDALKLTGVPRYDGLVDDDKKQIMISPTWRMQAAVPVRTSEGEQRDYNPLFKESTYYKVFNSLINDPRLIEAAKKYGYRIKYVLHPIVSAQVDDFDKNDYVDVIPAVGDMSYERMFCESSLMVTDFSGIQFDFAYMRKPLVYLHHKDIPQHYEEGTFFYDTMAFGEIAHDNDELIDLLCEYMASGCKMKEEYVRRADDFFYYKDRENCKRIYDVMIDYQDKYILKKGTKA